MDVTADSSSGQIRYSHSLRYSGGYMLVRLAGAAGVRTPEHDLLSRLHKVLITLKIAQHQI